MNNTPAVEMQELFARSEEICKELANEDLGPHAELRENLRRIKEISVELMRENEQLRLRGMLLERQRLEAEQRLDHSRLGKENEQLRSELEMLTMRLGELERQSEKYRNRFERIEQHHMALSNVYVASHQLHATLDFTEVVRTAEEILWNLVAAPVFAIFLHNERTGDYMRVGGIGTEYKFPDDILADPSPLITESISTGEPLFLDDATTGDPLACIPLKVEGRGVVGLIAVYAIEEHKEALSDLDKELFELLASQTATALSSSRVYSETIKKLKSMESFISLIKPE